MHTSQTDDMIITGSQVEVLGPDYSVYYSQVISTKTVLYPTYLIHKLEYE